MHDISGDLSIFKNVEFGLIDCVREISEGQHLDMEFEKRKIISEDQYLEMILKKTAVMFMFAAEAGAIIGGGTKEQANALNEYGKSIGLGFQIHDDYLDMSSDKQILGKDIGNDIRNGKKTLIAVHCLNNVSEEDKKFLEKIFGNLKATDEEVKQVFNLFKKVGSIEYAKNTAIKYCENAKKSLDILTDSKAKEILLALADYSINREN
jgi:geranylgeranyl diphosphate synthase type I